MGNEHSTEEAARLEKVRDDFRARIEAKKEALLPQYVKQYEDWQAEKDARKAANTTLNAGDPTSAQDQDRDRDQQPKLLRSSKGDVQPHRRMTPASDELLQSFHPRKERADNGSTSASKPSTLPKLNTNPERIRDATALSQDPPGLPKTSPTSAGPSKRPVPSAFTDERRPSLVDLPKIRKKTSTASPRSPMADETARMDERPPRWYTDCRVPNTRSKHQSNADIALRNLKDDISKGRTLTSNQQSLERLASKIRDQLHTVAFLEVSEVLLKTNRMLHNIGGLPSLFDAQHNGGVSWPWDIKADAEELYNKWCRKIFVTDLLRGVKPSVPGKSSASLDPDYDKIPANRFGYNGLINGQWWPHQICTIVDGAHGSTEGGIYGHVGKGAYSCIISEGKDYPNVDHGEDVTYFGTYSAKLDGTISPGTSMLIETFNNKQPVRFIRSSKEDSPYAPKLGFRYDGLYEIKGYKRTDPVTSLRQGHSFHLVRLPGQDPIRGGDGPETRPTREEIDAYKKDKRLRGFKD